MKRNLLSMSLLLASLIAAQPLLAQESAQTVSHDATTQVPDPAVQIRSMVNMLRGNDLNGLLRAMVPPAHYQELRQAYDLARVEPITDEDRAKFAEELAKLTAVDAVDQIMVEIEPKLIEARPQAAGALMMGLGALQVAIGRSDSDMTDEQRNALRQAFPGIQRWATATDFLSESSIRQALTLITDAARNTGIDSIDELKLLSIDEVLNHASSLLAAGKQALRIYGLDLDAIADSTRVEVLAIDGSNARVRTTVTLFDAPMSKDIDLVLVDGRWYGKDAVIKWEIHSDEHSEG
jgi:hypothetical protein